MKDRKAEVGKRWEIYMVRAAHVCREVGRMDGEREQLRKHRTG